jgi:starch-binding outer membrane protein, SusD/RagB family
MGVSLALMATTLSSCNLDTTPTTSLDSDAAFKTTTYAENVLRGAWSYAFNEGQTYQSIGIFSVLLSDDFMGSDCVKAKSYGYSQCYNLTVGYGRGQHNSVLWDICYDAINNCNNIIANIDKASGSDTDKSRIKGQAYATRGYMYMMLASHFAFSVEKDPHRLQ